MYSKRAILLWETIGMSIIVTAFLITPTLHPIGQPVVSTPICVGMAIALTFHKSGAHLNPAVTGFLTIFGKIRWSRILVYLAASFSVALVIPGIWRLLSNNGVLPTVPLETVDPGFMFWKELVATIALLGYITIFVLLGKGVWTIVFIPIFLASFQFLWIGGADMNPTITVAMLVVGKYDLASFWAHLAGEVLAMVGYLICGHGLGSIRRRMVSRRHPALLVN